MNTFVPNKAKKDDWMKHNERLEKQRQQLIKKQQQEALKQQQEAIKQQQETAKNQIASLKAQAKAKAKNDVMNKKAEDQQNELDRQEVYHILFEKISDKIREDKSLCDLECFKKADKVMKHITSDKKLEEDEYLYSLYKLYRS